jgi:hypothetical protein
MCKRGPSSSVRSLIRLGSQRSASGSRVNGAPHRLLRCSALRLSEDFAHESPYSKSRLRVDCHPAVRLARLCVCDPVATRAGASVHEPWACRTPLLLKPDRVDDCTAAVPRASRRAFICRRCVGAMHRASDGEVGTGSGAGRHVARRSARTRRSEIRSQHSDDRLDSARKRAAIERERSNAISGSIGTRRRFNSAATCCCGASYLFERYIFYDQHAGYTYTQRTESGATVSYVGCKRKPAKTSKRTPHFLGSARSVAATPGTATAYNPYWDVRLLSHSTNGWAWK